MIDEIKQYIERSYSDFLSVAKRYAYDPQNIEDVVHDVIMGVMLMDQSKIERVYREGNLKKYINGGIVMQLTSSDEHIRRRYGFNKKVLRYSDIRSHSETISKRNSLKNPIDLSIKHDPSYSHALSNKFAMQHDILDPITTEFNQLGEFNDELHVIGDWFSREVMRLKIEGYTAQEISDMTGITKVNIDRTIAQSKKQLLKKL